MRSVCIDEFNYKLWLVCYINCNCWRNSYPDHSFVFYKGYNNIKMVISSLGNNNSPVRILFNLWML